MVRFSNLSCKSLIGVQLNRPFCFFACLFIYVFVTTLLNGKIKKPLKKKNIILLWGAKSLKTHATLKYCTISDTIIYVRSRSKHVDIRASNGSRHVQLCSELCFKRFVCRRACVAFLSVGVLQCVMTTNK